MVIQGDFYQIIPSGESSMFFDLKLLHKVKGKNPRDEFKDAGYGLTLQSAINKCIQYALQNKFETLSLKEYLDEFTKMQEEIGLHIQRGSIPASKTSKQSMQKTE